MAAPGDPGLLTVAGRAALAGADVIVTDRLAPVGALHEIAPPRAQIIDASKIPPGGRRTEQYEINEMLIEHALAGRTVVRLKGGDGFVFGRGGEEADECVRAGVTVEVIPGVSSAIAAPPAAALIPVTHRGLTQASPWSPATFLPTIRTARSTTPRWPAPIRRSC